MPRRLNEASERAEIEQLGRDNDTIALTGKTAEQMLQLISALDDSIDASNAADARLEWLTKWLVELTCVLVVLTIALLARIVTALAQNRPPQVVEVTYERLGEWTRRIHTPTSSTIVGLGWGAEYWDPDPTHYEGWLELRDRYKALGRKKTNRDLAFELSAHLLEEVVAAGGGVEHAINQLRGAVADLKKVADENSAKGPIGLSFPAATEALYAFGDVITWARAVEERLDRRPPSRHSGKMRNQGLVPALKPLRLKKRVELLVKQLRAGPVGACRLLANFTLHAALVRNPFAGAQLTADGAVTLPIPDPPAHPINHWYLFTWNDGRDGIAFAEEVWKSIQVFIDDLLNAFEKAVPKRLRPQKGP